MSVKIISYSRPFGVEIGDKPDDIIAYTARVSNPSNQHNHETAPRLLRYLAKHEHWSPFEMASLCLEINTTRDIARQILRHRSFSFQEFSQRYAEVAWPSGFTLREARMQDNNNRQNSIPSTDFTIDDMWTIQQNKLLAKAADCYRWALDNGIAKEQARAVLPEGLTMSRLYMHGTVRSWMHYIKVRTHESTQKEHRMIAEECKKCLLEIYPSLREFFDEN